MANVNRPLKRLILIAIRDKGGVSFIYDKEHIYNSMDDSLSGEKFIITNKPHKKRVDGFPLDSLSIECNTGKYYFNLDESESSFSDIKKVLGTFLKKRYGILIG